MNATKKEEPDHAVENARGWVETIVEWRTKLDDDARQERIDELEETISTFEHEDPDAVSMDEYTKAKAELVELNDFDRDELEQEVRESPLSVQVRSGWVSPGEQMQAEEFEILLSTGGPALRIIGELDRGSPCTASLQH